MQNLFKSLEEKYSLKPNTYSNDTIISVEDYTKWISSLIERWGNRFIHGYYNLGLCPLPLRWHCSIWEALEVLEKDSPQFKIAQIKIKFGGLRLYLEDISSDALISVDILETLLYDDCFCY